MAITLLETKDHSHTLYVPELDETYHSRNGAIEEAMYVYIGKGLEEWLGGELVVGPQSADHGGELIGPQSTVHSLDHSSQITDHGGELIGPQSTVHSLDHGSQITDHGGVLVGPQSTVHGLDNSLDHGSQITDHGGELVGPQSTVHGLDHGGEIGIEQETMNGKLKTVNRKPKTVNLLEIGFGTGLNAWLTALECDKLNAHCYYHSLETFPLGSELISQLNYTSGHSDAHTKMFGLLHKAQWDTSVKITNRFTLHKAQVSLQDFIPQTGFDVIYFDAFAPEKQPELWTEALFRKLYDALNPGGIIVTYSSKGDIKRMWKEIGFEVERLKGPPFKRHMLRGRKEMRNAK
jgi:tRNA U34 5-methylaminomethyl-2-thiouridine-forming methyltransferase MnmC